MAVLVGRQPLRTLRRVGYVAERPTPLHLARELVQADRDARYCLSWCLWDHAQAWIDYRERLQEWRFFTVRGRDPSHLFVCPGCGAVQQLEPGPVTCFACNLLWSTDG